MGFAGIFSTSGVLDSAGNANVSFLAKKSENKQFASLLHNIVPKYCSLKTSSSNRLFQEIDFALNSSYQVVNKFIVHFHQGFLRIPSREL